VTFYGYNKIDPRLMASFPGQPGWADTGKVKAIPILMKQEMMGRQWHQLDHMQITCTSLQTMPVTNHSVSTGQMLFLKPNQQCQTTEGNLWAYW